MKKEFMFGKIEKLYFNKTFSEVTTQDIADLFGINKASLYHYFKSKEDLFIELLDYSFKNFIDNLMKIMKKDLDGFIKNYLNYPSESKNLFTIINQNHYCKKNSIFLNDIQKKQKEIFNILYSFFNKKYGFSEEKTFILYSLLDSLSRKKCVLGGCFVDLETLLGEIKTLFIKN